MSLVAILLFTGTMALSLWATIRVRQVYNRFSLVPASSGSTGGRHCCDNPSTGRDFRRGDRGTPDTQAGRALSRKFSRNVGGGPGYCGTRVRSCHPTQGSLYAFAMADGFGGLTAFASQIVLWLPLLGMFTGFLNTGMALILIASAWGVL